MILLGSETSTGQLALIVGGFSIVSLLLTGATARFGRNAQWRRDDLVAERAEIATKTAQDQAQRAADKAAEVANRAAEVADKVAEVAEKAGETHAMVQQIDRAVNGKPPGETTLVKQVQDMTDAAKEGARDEGIVAALARIEKRLNSKSPEEGGGVEDDDQKDKEEVGSGCDQKPRKL